MTLVACAALAACAAATASAAACKPYVFVGARGSGEGDAAGDSGMGGVVSDTYNTVASLLPNTIDAHPLRSAEGYRAVPVYTRSDLEALGAAALIGGPTGLSIAAVVGTSRYASYNDSVRDGKAGLAAVLQQLASDCPSSKVLLAGYSQGAHVVEDTLQEVDATVRSHVLAVALFGDPRFDPVGRGTLGTFDVRRHGLLGSRPADSPVKTQSFCVSGDPVCQGFVYASGWPPALHGFSVSAHFSYVLDGWAGQAGMWMYQLVRRDIAASGGTEPPAPAPAMRPLDLSLVVDTTGSMGGAIDNVRTNLQSIRDELAARTSDFRLALTEFKDYGDVFQSQLDLDFTNDGDAFSTALDGLFASGGGDTPESVYSGLETGLTAVSWRADAAKAVVLVGDAPPHDPEEGTGLTESDVVTEALRVPAPIFALNVCCDTEASDAFGRLAADTSGQQLSPDDGGAVADAILDAIAAQSETPTIRLGGLSFLARRGVGAGAAKPLAAGDAETIPVGTTTYFSAGGASSPLGEELTYRWDFGDGTVVEADAAHTVVGHAYDAPFDGDVKLTVTDEDGRSAQALLPLSVGGDPVAPLGELAAPSLHAEDGAVSASWTPPAAGQPTYYELQRDGQTVASVLADRPLSARLEGLPNGQPVDLRVVAYDSYGNSVASPVVRAVPTAPTAAAGVGGSRALPPAGGGATAAVRTGAIVVWNRGRRALQAALGGHGPVRVPAGGARRMTGPVGSQTLQLTAGTAHARARTSIAPGTLPLLSAARRGGVLAVRATAKATVGKTLVVSLLRRAVRLLPAGGTARRLTRRAPALLSAPSTAAIVVRIGARSVTIRPTAEARATIVMLLPAGAHGVRVARFQAPPG